MISKAIAGDYFGDVNIEVGTLWHGPSAMKFKGLHLVDEGIRYDAEDILNLVYLSEENIKSFLDSAFSAKSGGLAIDDEELFSSNLSAGNQKILRLGIEFKDGRKIMLAATDNRILQCLLLFAEDKGIIE